MDQQSLDGRTAIVTGASRGIGAAIARALTAPALASRSSPATGRRSEAVAADMHNGPVVLPVDLADPDAPARLVAEARDRVGAIDVLVNNAALAARAPTDELDAELIDGCTRSTCGRRCC